MEASAQPSAAPTGQRHTHATIFVAAALSLFVEMFLVRWVGSEVRLVAYFRGLALLAAFLGIGVGYQWRWRRPGLWVVFAALSALALLSHPDVSILDVRPRDALRFISPPEGLLWQSTFTATPAQRGLAWVFALLFYLLSVASMVPFGALLGELFSRATARAQAYAWDLAGSGVGVALFAALSFMEWTPAAWVLVMVVTAAVLERKHFAGLVGVLVLGTGSLSLVVRVPDGVDAIYFSPYQTLTVREHAGTMQDTAVVDVNGAFFQAMLDGRPSTLAAKLGPGWEARSRGDPYNLPYSAVGGNVGNVLVLGAGTGNDVAAALRAGASHVDAVELDPVIARLGRESHPEHPYQDPRVTLHVTDARGFIMGTKERYNIIVFGLLDSHALSGTRGNVSLDSFVYTKESLDRVATLLQPDGLVFLNFHVTSPWMCSRLLGLLGNATGKSTLVILQTMPAGYGADLSVGGWGALMVGGDVTRFKKGLDAQPDLAADVAGRPSPSSCGAPSHPTTDDWPYIYLEKPSIPPLFIPLSLMVALASLLVVRLSMKRTGSADPSFFFLGAAFLFAELHAVSRCSLLFGNTWLVSAAAVAGVLGAVSAGNLVALGTGVRVRTAAVVLLLGLLGNALLPLDWLLLDSMLARLVVSGAVLGWPLAAASVIFVRLFSATDRADTALSINLLGAVAGGLLECVTFYFGLASADVVAILLYVLALALMREPALKAIRNA